MSEGRNVFQNIRDSRAHSRDEGTECLDERRIDEEA